jgi:hypothetical protein
MVGHQALRQTQPSAQLAHLPVTAGQLGQQPPAQRVSGQAQETRRNQCWPTGYRIHAEDNTSIRIDRSIIFDGNSSGFLGWMPG